MRARGFSQGFTLIEILVVISVIGVLIGISIPRIKGMQEAAKVSKAGRELKALQAAVESYRTFHSNTSPSDITTSLTGANPQLITTPLADPFNNTDYQYIQRGQFYAIATVGPNGVSDSFTMSSEGTVTVSGDDTAVTNGSFGSFVEAAAESADPCDAGSNPQPGTECADHSIYVNASLRTTAGDAGQFAWIDCAACGGNNPDSACYDTDWNWVCSGGEPNPAAQACTSLGAGWHLPSQGELDQLFQVSNCKSANGSCDDAGAVVGGFVAGYYWSSTEVGSSLAWLQVFGSGGQYGYGKYVPSSVRCVRSP